MMRVLVVEDEEMIRKGIVLATDWQSLGCVVVGEAANGEEGIAQAEKCRPSLIITDLKMPKMDGLEMIAKLREAGCDAYIIILTAYDRRPFGWERWIFCSSRFMTEIWKTRCLRCRRS